ncbi:hypothetical protein [Actinoplanes subtropicus]|uniref:hypothetical protein n=1 Tax=Actinoplanes subtropicus TaxID=543632 RepID=UPI00146FDBD9|nr:hypothetical protein [Actinoplanes subtropicus]
MVTTVIAGAVRERRPGKRRVALVPEANSRLGAAGIHVLVEEGTGVAAGFSDEDRESAGAEVVPGANLVERAHIVLCVGPARSRRDARPAPPAEPSRPGRGGPVRASSRTASTCCRAR